MGAGQVVDTPSAQEFMREVLERVSADDLATASNELEAKSARFRLLLSADALGALQDPQYRGVLRSIFATRRRTATVMAGLPLDEFRPLALALLHGGGPVAQRFQTFVDAAGPVLGAAAADVASELLHYTFPEIWWLWTRWMWDPQTGTGALRLVTMEEYDLRAGTPGETYVRVGEAVAFVHSTGDAAGFTRIGRGLYGTHLYLACVYAIYMYTVLRLRMTQEFNKVVPELPELVRRLLGVYRLEV